MLTGRRGGYTGAVIEAPREEYEDQDPPENQDEEPGAEGGTGSEAADKLPGAPAGDSSPLGDTDQHSDA